MDNIFIYKELKSEFDKHINENVKFNEINVQRASWRFGVYPSTSQIYEIRACQQEEDYSVGLEFYEFCLLIATIKYAISYQKHSFKIKPQGSIPANQKARWDVFLGGACNPTTWRLDVAIPFLKEKNITFYNPQVSQWDPSLIEIEDLAKESARVLLFVLDLKRTRGIASLVEAAFLSGQGRNLVLVVPSERPKSLKDVDVKSLDENEFQSINRSYLFIVDLVQRQGIPLFRSVQDALKAIRICLISKSMIQDLTDIDGVVPVKHSFVNVSRTVKTLQMIFQTFDTNKSGTINQNDLNIAIQRLFKQQIPIISQGKPFFTFPEFCIEYSVILLTLLQHRVDHPRSYSEINFKIRCSSLETLEQLDRDGSLKSSINLKPKVEVACVSPNKAKHSEEMVTLCNCLNKNNKLTHYLIRLLTCPFRRSAIKPLTLSEIEQHVEAHNVQPEPFTCVDQGDMYDVYLGGTCGNSNWREKIAIPIIKQAGCTYYDPKMNNAEWSRKLLPIEAEAREQSKVLVYVITNECTSTATLVEVGHYIGQGRKILLFIQMLTRLSSPSNTPISQFLQSSCSFPLSSLDTNGISFFSLIKSAESTTTGYQSNSNVSTSQFSLLPLSNKFSTSDGVNIGRNEDNSDLAISINNISKFNNLSQDACKDHNRGRKYLIDLARRAKVPILSSIEDTIVQAIKWSQKPSPSHGWTSKSNS